MLFTTIVNHVPRFDIPGYSLSGVARDVMEGMLLASPRGAKGRVVYSLTGDGNGKEYHTATVSIQNMRGTVLDKAVIYGKEPMVATKQSHANGGRGQFISCRADGCGSELFYNVDRSTFYENHICAMCGKPAQTLTETGACT